MCTGEAKNKTLIKYFPNTAHASTLALALELQSYRAASARSSSAERIHVSGSVSTRRTLSGALRGTARGRGALCDAQAPWGGGAA